MRNTAAFIILFLGISAYAQKNTDKQAGQDKVDTKYTEGASGVKRSISYKFSPSTSDEDPGSGMFRFNNDNISGISYIFLDNNDLSGDDQTKWYSTWDDTTGATARGQLTIVETEAQKSVNVFDIKGVFIKGSGFWKIPVAHVSGSMPADGSVCFYIFNRIEHKKNPNNQPEQVAVVTQPEQVAVVTQPEQVAVVTQPEHVAVVTQPEQVAVVTQPEQVAIVTQPEQVAVVSQPEQVAVVTQPEHVAVVTQPEQVAVVTQPEQVAVVTQPEQVAVVTQPEQVAVVTQTEQVAVVTQPEQVAVVTQPEQVAVVTQPEQVAVVTQPEQVAVVTQPEQVAVVTQPEQVAVVTQPEQVAAVTQPEQVAVVTQPEKVVQTEQVNQQQIVQVKQQENHAQTGTSKPVIEEQRHPGTGSKIQIGRNNSGQRTQTRPETQVNQSTGNKVTQVNQQTQTVQNKQQTNTTSSSVQTKQTASTTQITQKSQTVQVNKPAETTVVSQVTDNRVAQNTRQDQNNQNQTITSQVTSTVQEQSGNVTQQSGQYNYVSNYTPYQYGSARGGGKWYSGIIEVGYGLGMGDYGINNFRINFINGIKLGSCTSIGLGIGFRRYFEEESEDFYLFSGEMQIPVFLDFRTSFSTKPVTPYLAFGIGNTLSTNGSDSKKGLYICPSGGIWFNISSRFAVFGGIAYEMQKLEFANVSDGSRFEKTASSLSLNIGISF